MTKIAILGDLHLGVHKGHAAFSDALRIFINELFVPTLEKEGITQVIQLGDVVDRPTGIRYVDMIRLRSDFIEPLLGAGGNLHVLVGNHDAPYNRDTLTPSAPVELFNGYRDIHVYDRPCETSFGGLYYCVMLPWICRDNADASFDLLKRTKGKVVFGHLELNGFDMHRGVTCHEGMDLSLFKDFNLVVSGHFHQPSKAGVIQYAGAPYQMTWADAGCARGFWILDTETLDMKFIQNPKNMYAEINYDDKASPDTFMSVRDKFVKVIVNERTPSRFDAFLKHLEIDGAIEVKVVEPGTDLTTNIEIDEAKYDLDSPTKIFHDYVVGMADEKIYNKQKLEFILVKTHTEALTL